MKVLIMPSWYPNKKHKSGSFFQEQAKFLNSNGFEVKVLVAEELHTESYIYHSLKRLIKGESNKLTTNYLEQDPEAYSFPVIIEKRWSEKKKIRVSNKKYLKAFKILIESGWMPDIIHVQNTFKAGFSAQFISEIYDLPYFVIEHSPFKLASYSLYIQQKIKNVLRHANKIAGVSNHQKQCMIADGIDGNIEVVWNFMDENKFEIKPSNTSKFVISSITMPVKIKDVNTLFKAIACFVSKIEDRSAVEVVIVGNDFANTKYSNTAYFQKQAAKFKVLDICTIIPYLSRTEIKTLLNKTNVFISTSLFESYGIAIREAMLSGVPVISTRSGGPEDSLNERTGVLVDIRDSKAIAKSLHEIYNGYLTFNLEYIRNYVIAQSGRANFLKTMTKFYSISND